jgi:hypothetical protein
MRRAYLATGLVLVVSTAAAQHRHPPHSVLCFSLGGGI